MYQSLQQQTEKKKWYHNSSFLHVSHNASLPNSIHSAVTPHISINMSSSAELVIHRPPVSEFRYAYVISKKSLNYEFLRTWCLNYTVSLLIFNHIKFCDAPACLKHPGLIYEYSIITINILFFKQIERSILKATHQFDWRYRWL